MAIVPDDFGAGLRDIPPGGSGKPALVDYMKALNRQGAGEIGWVTGIAVSTNVAVLPSAGLVFAVDGTAASATGPKAMRQVGTVAAGQVLVEYDAAGIATLTFNATDAVTVAAITFLAFGEGLAT